ncbi:MAG: methyltransferase domain-containing protein [Pseudomonadota bacterium]
MLRKWTDHAASEWLQTPLGESLIAQETRIVEEALDGIFGEECLQLGLWGEPRAFLRYSRTQRSALVADCLPEDAAATPFVYGEPHKLPLQDDAVDCIVLPHTLDYSDRPHETLREVHRALRPNGHIIVLGFRPGGLWGLRRLIPGAELPPGADHMISDRRLCDWLKVLGMRVQALSGYFFRWPLPGLKGTSSPVWERRGQRWWSELSACYVLSAQKRVGTLTPVRPKWKTKPKVVAGLVEPSTRVSRIRFDNDR